MKSRRLNEGSKQILLLKVFLRYILAFVFMGSLLFIPAGSLKFINGWLFIAGLMVPMTITLIYLIIMDRELLGKRIQMQEKESAQKKYILLSSLLFTVAYIIPGLDFRYSWSAVPIWLVLLSLVIMISGYVLFVVVMLQNRYASRVVEIQDKQRLIDTGLYRLVRHPMYFAVTILFLSSSLVLGSYLAVIPMLFLPLLLAFRILNEEKVLKEGLPGYTDYMKRVKYRMIPYIW